MRRRLFSQRPRRKLFSDEREGNRIQTLICSDCGHKVESADSTTKNVCPKCGGKRFNLEKRYFTPPPSVDNERIPLYSDESGEERFQKSFCQTTDPFELKLKRYSGRSIDTSECERIFGIPASEMEEKGFAEIHGNTMDIPEGAFLQSRLFSKLIISVTKVLDLDPEIMHSSSPFEHGISRIKDCGCLKPSGIIMIKKAHGVPVSGPCEMAPHEMFDELERRGVIRISGDHLDIIR